MLPAEAAVGRGRARPRVLLVDDHALLRTGVANIINQEPDLHVVAEAGNGVEALEAYDRHHPDVTLLDLRMPVMEGVEVVRRIRERDPRARVIILTTYDTDDEISRALKAGAKAYVLKDISADDLVGCIRDVLAGKTYLAPAAAAKLAEGVTRVQLTPREMATLRLLADGKANKEIANELDISERTVKTHLGHLFEKLGVTSRTEAIKVATRRGSSASNDSISSACGCAIRSSRGPSSANRAMSSRGLAPLRPRTTRPQNGPSACARTASRTPTSSGPSTKAPSSAPTFCGRPGISSRRPISGGCSR